MANAERRFDPAAILEILVRHDVRFVVIGGLAGNSWGSPSVTQDLDISYARDPRNLERLASALKEIGVALRGADPDLPFRADARTLRMGDHFTFATRYGPFDILGTPKGTAGFEELDRTAVERDVVGVRVRVVRVPDLVRMKVAAGRPKDLVEVEVLGALLEELERRGEE